MSRGKKKVHREWLFEQYKAEHPEQFPVRHRRKGRKLLKVILAILLFLWLNLTALMLACMMNPYVEELLLG